MLEMPVSKTKRPLPGAHALAASWCESAPAARTRYHERSGLNTHWMFLSHSPGGWKSTITVSAGPSLLSLQTAPFLLCPHGAFAGCPYFPVSLRLLTRTHATWTRAHPNDLIQPQSSTLRPHLQTHPWWGLELQHVNVGRYEGVITDTIADPIFLDTKTAWTQTVGGPLPAPSEPESGIH